MGKYNDVHYEYVIVNAGLWVLTLESSFKTIRLVKQNASLNKKESILFKIEIFQGRRQNHKKLKKTQQE